MRVSRPGVANASACSRPLGASSSVSASRAAWRISSLWESTFSEAAMIRPAPSLHAAQLAALAALARQVEVALGGPQDIEWAVEDGTIYVLQARPVTT